MLIQKMIFSTILKLFLLFFCYYAIINVTTKLPITKFNFVQVNQLSTKIEKCESVIIFDLSKSITSKVIFDISIKNFLKYILQHCNGFKYVVIDDNWNDCGKICNITINNCENECSEIIDKFNYISMTSTYSENLVSNDSESFSQFLKEVLSVISNCKDNSVLLLTNRIVSIKPDSELTEILSHTKLSIFLLGRSEEKAQEMLDNAYSNLSNVTTLSFPNYDCLSYLFYCILPCSNDKPECMKEDIEDCQIVTTLPDPDPDQTWHLWCIFDFNTVMKNETFNVILNSLLNGISDFIQMNNVTKYRLRFVISDDEITTSYNSIDYLKIEFPHVWHVPINDSVVDDTFHLNERLSYIPWSETLTKTRPGILSVIILTNYASVVLKTSINEQKLSGQMYIYDVAAYWEYFPTLSNSIYLHLNYNYNDSISIYSLKQDVDVPPSSTVLQTTPLSKTTTPTTIMSNDTTVTETLTSSLSTTSTSLQKGQSSTEKTIIICAICAGILILFFISAIYCYRRRLHRNTAISQMFMQSRRHSLKSLNEITTDKNDEWELTWNKLDIKNEIATGVYGKILYANLRREADVHQNEVEVAIKIPYKYPSAMTKMKVVSGHVNVVKMFGCITSDNVLCLILEFCSNFDLHTFVKDLKISKKEKNIKREFFLFAWQISHGLQYLSSQGIIHRNLAASNILIDSKKNAKISDFGLAIYENEKNTICSKEKRKGITKWLAIECLRDNAFSYKSDIWAFGIILYEMYSFGEIPYANIEIEKQLKFLETGNRLEKPEYCSDELFEIMKTFWLVSPSARPTAKETIKIFKDFLKQSTEGYGYIELLESAVNKNDKALIRQFSSFNEF